MGFVIVADDDVLNIRAIIDSEEDYIQFNAKLKSYADFFKKETTSESDANALSPAGRPAALPDYPER